MYPLHYGTYYHGYNRLLLFHYYAREPSRCVVLVCCLMRVGGLMTMMRSYEDDTHDIREDSQRHDSLYR